SPYQNNYLLLGKYLPNLCMVQYIQSLLPRDDVRQSVTTFCFWGDHVLAFQNITGTIQPHSELSCGLADISLPYDRVFFQDFPVFNHLTQANQTPHTSSPSVLPPAFHTKSPFTNRNLGWSKDRAHGTDSSWLTGIDVCDQQHVGGFGI